MLLGITENERPACFNRYLRRGDLEASIKTGSLLEFSIKTNYQMKLSLTSIKHKIRRYKARKVHVVLYINGMPSFALRGEAEKIIRMQG